MYSIFHRLLQNRFTWRYTLLLLVMIALFILRPLFSLSEHTVLIIDLVESLLILASIVIFENSPSRVIISSIISLPAFVMTWLDWYIQSTYIELIRNASLAVLLIYTFLLVVTELIKEVEINFDHLLAAISGYFLIGFSFASIYEVVEIVSAGSFTGNSHLGSSLISNNQNDLLYYSFSTLLTEGFGDILPVTIVSRTLSMLEGIAGQFYLTFIVARIVGLHISKLYSNGKR